VKLRDPVNVSVASVLLVASADEVDESAVVLTPTVVVTILVAAAVLAVATLVLVVAGA
jgi:hypothetical protein